MEEITQFVLDNIMYSVAVNFVGGFLVLGIVSWIVYKVVRKEKLTKRDFIISAVLVVLAVGLFLFTGQETTPLY
jgi:cytochrome bd-type quinol oxidase subunit 1